MRRVRIHHQNRDVIIGACRLPRHAPVGPRLRDFLRAGAAYPSSPATVDWTPAAQSVLSNIEGNDNFGDCVFAENAHFVGVETGNAGSLFSYSRAQTLADYSAETGFNASDPSTDQGADPIVDLNYFTQNAYADGTKNLGWALVDATNQDEVRYAVNTFGNVKMWLGLPDGIIQSMPSGDGFVWDTDRGAPDQNNGHCVGGYGYGVNRVNLVNVTAQGAVTATWGMLGIMTWAALAQWCIPSQGGGLAVRVTMDWVNRNTGNTPTGLNASAMVSSFNQWFNSNVPVPPAPAPTPPPAPPTPVAATLANAQAAISGAFAQDGSGLYVADQAIALAQGAMTTLTWPS
jgi:hypothetical protein